jgi:hypothetical protein
VNRALADVIEMNAVPKDTIAQEVAGSEFAEVISEENTFLGSLGIFVFVIGLFILTALFLSCCFKASKKNKALQLKLAKLKRKLFWNSII